MITNVLNMQTPTDQKLASVDESWLYRPIFNESTIAHFLGRQTGEGVNSTKASGVRGSDIIFLYRNQRDENGILKPDTRREKIGDYLPQMGDVFTGSNWVNIIIYTLEGQLNLIYSQNAVSTQLKEMNEGSIAKVKEFALSLLRVWRSNLTLKQFMHSTTNIHTKTKRGYLNKDIRLGAISLDLRLEDLVDIPEEFDFRNTLHLELKAGFNKSRSLTQDSQQLQVFPASAFFISEDRSKQFGGCILFDDGYSKNNTEIHSVLLNITAALLQYEDFLKFGDSKNLNFYVDKVANPECFDKWAILLELRITHINFYQSIQGLLEAFTFSPETREIYNAVINRKIDEVDVHFPLPASKVFYSICNKVAASSKLRNLRGDFSMTNERAVLSLEKMEKLLEAFKAPRAPADDLQLIQNTPVHPSSTSIRRPTKRKINFDEIKVSSRKKKRNTKSVLIVISDDSQDDERQFPYPPIISTNTNLDCSITNANLDFFITDDFSNTLFKKSTWDANPQNTVEENLSCSSVLPTCNSKQNATISTFDNRNSSHPPLPSHQSADVPFIIDFTKLSELEADRMIIDMLEVWEYVHQ